MAKLSSTGLALLLFTYFLLFTFASGVGAQGPTPTPSAGSSEILSEPSGGILKSIVDVFVGAITWVAKKTGREVPTEDSLPAEVTIFNLWRINLWPNFLIDSPLSYLIDWSSRGLLIACLLLMIGYLIFSFTQVFSGQFLRPKETLGFVGTIMVLTVMAAAQAEFLMVPIVLASRVVENVGNTLSQYAGDPLVDRIFALYDFFSNTGTGDLVKSGTTTAALFGFMIYEYSFFSLALNLLGVFGLWFAFFALIFSGNYKAVWSVFSWYLILCGVLIAFAIGLQLLSSFLTSSEFIRNIDWYLPGSLLLLIIGPPGGAFGLLMMKKVYGRVEQEAAEAIRA